MINFYSLLHFILYFFFGKYLFFSWRIFLLVSLSWELLEIFLPFQFAVETFENKFFDIIFNALGFYLGIKSKQN